MKSSAGADARGSGGHTRGNDKGAGRGIGRKGCPKGFSDAIDALDDYRSGDTFDGFVVQPPSKNLGFETARQAQCEYHS
jgi:hypothetical protein